MCIQKQGRMALLLGNAFVEPNGYLERVTEM